MSRTTVLAVAPLRRPVELVEFRNSFGWAPSIWPRLLTANGLSPSWITDDRGLLQLWKMINDLPEYQQAALVLTFDTGVIPFRAFEWAADTLDEFEHRHPCSGANHVPAMAKLFRTRPEAPFIGVWGTSVSGNPFDPWDYQTDSPGSGITFEELFLLDCHLAP